MEMLKYIIYVSASFIFSIPAALYIRGYKSSGKTPPAVLPLCFIIGTPISVLSCVQITVHGITAESAAVCVIIALLTVISVIDLLYFEIPLPINAIIFVLSAIICIFDYEHIFGHLTGMLAISGFMLAVYLVSKGNAMGGGDVKLMFAAGLGLGIGKSVFAFIAACALASVLHIIVMKFTEKGKLFAFGPYLSVGIIASYLIGDFAIASYGKFISFGG